jgi:hypothetical protein
MRTEAPSWPSTPGRRKVGSCPRSPNRSRRRRRRLRLIRAEGATELFTSHVIGKGGPGGFYDRLGFVPTGELDSEGERIPRLDLAPATDQSR